MMKMFGIAAALALFVAAPAVAAPAPGARPDQAPTDPRRALDADLPDDSPAASPREAPPAQERQKI